MPGFTGGAVKPTTWLLQAPITVGSNWWPQKGASNPYDNPTLISPQKNAPGVIVPLRAAAAGGGGGVSARSASIDHMAAGGGMADSLALPPFAFLTVEYDKVRYP